jgi:hypothetical protein
MQGNTGAKETSQRSKCNGMYTGAKESKGDPRIQRCSRNYYRLRDQEIKESRCRNTGAQGEELTGNKELKV